MYRKDTVIVTGGAGYIGSHACKALHEAGYQPVVYDNLVYGHAHAVKWGALVVGDILDAKLLDEVMAEYQPCAVLHFAAFAYVGESVEDPGKYYENNVSGTINLLEAMRRNDVKNIVFSSTCATYGTPESLPIGETEKQVPINPYGRSKLMIEQMLDDYGSAYGFNHAALRYFNAAGADAAGEIGEEHDPEPHLIPRVLMAASGEIPHLDVFGDDWDTPDGTCVRDYIHVTDLADGHVKALNHLLNGGDSCKVNLGTGKGTSIAEIIAATAKVTGRRIPVKMVSRRPGDPAALFADPHMAREIFGFETRHSDIENIIETAWNFHSAKTEDGRHARSAVKNPVNEHLADSAA